MKLWITTRSSLVVFSVSGHSKLWILLIRECIDTMKMGMVKRILFGRPLKSNELENEKMPVWKALPILSSDALSSVSYGTEQILLELATVGVVAFAFSIPIAIAIILLITLLVISYRQVIDAYPQ